MGLKEKTASSIKWNTVATVTTMVISVLQVAILTRLLEKSDFGLIAIASMVIAFTDIFAELGITVALIHKQNISNEVYSSVYWLNISLSIVICALTMLGAPLVAIFYKQPELTAVIRLLSIKILISAFGKMFQTIKTKNLEFGFISKVRILTSVVGIVTSTLLAWCGFGVMSLVWGQLVQAIVNQGIYAVAGLKDQRILFHFSFSEVRDVMKIGGYQLGNQILDFIAARLDVFIIGRFFTMDQLGVYNIAKELIIKPFSVINSISSSVFSAAFAKVQDNIQLVINNYHKIVRFMSMIATPIYVAMFIFADLLVAILYAPAFSEVALFIRILSVVGISSAITSQAAPVMVALGRTDLGLHWTIIRVVLSITVILISASISLYAVAYGQTLLAVMSLVIYFFIVIRPMFVSITLKQYISMFINIVIATLLIALPFALLNICFVVPVVLQVLMAIAFMTVYYLYLHKFYRSDLNEIMGIILPNRIKR